MKISILNNSEVDRIQWDLCVSTSINESPYGYCYYLDIVCPDWIGVVIGDYKAICPLPIKSKFGIKYFHQPSLLQRVALFGDYDENDEKLIVQEIKRIRFGDFNIEQQILPSAKKMTNIELDLNLDSSDVRDGYSQNCRRNIKKSIKEEIVIESGSIDDLDNISELFELNKGREIESLPSDFYEKLKLICQQANKLGKLNVLEAKKNDKIIGAILVISSLKRKLLIFTASTALAKQTGAMHLLLSTYIESHCNTENVFDFEGSMNEGVSRFYKGFGGVETNYYNYQFNKNPLRKLVSPN